MVDRVQWVLSLVTNYFIHMEKLPFSLGGGSTQAEGFRMKMGCIIVLLILSPDIIVQCTTYKTIHGSPGWSGGAGSVSALIPHDIFLSCRVTLIS